MARANLPGQKLVGEKENRANEGARDECLSIGYGPYCDRQGDAATKAHMEQFTGCIAGALTRREFEEALAAAGLVDIEIQETHRVHEKAGSAIVRARKPL
jgi:hypothetical protein